MDIISLDKVKVVIQVFAFSEDVLVARIVDGRNWFLVDIIFSLTLLAGFFFHADVPFCNIKMYDIFHSFVR